MIGWFDFQDWEFEALKDSGLEVEKFEDSLSEENCQGFDFDFISVFASSSVTGEVLEEISPEAVFTRSTGFDHINLEKAEELDVDVYNVPHYGSNTVAEHAFGLLLSLSKKIPESIERTKQSFTHEGLTGFELEDKTLGVIGTGEIGQKAVKMGKGFDMDVIAFDPYGDDSLEHELGFMYVSMRDLLEKADVISVHCPLTSQNKYMFSKTQFQKMDDTVFINTARGGLVNSKHLLEALKKGNVKAAGLDVLDMEDEMRKRETIHEKTEFAEDELEANRKLIEREDTIVTPHNAFNTEEAKQRILETTIQNIKETPCENKVN
jgi:D-lactate dehydrogenase